MRRCGGGAAGRVDAARCTARVCRCGGDPEWAAMVCDRSTVRPEHGSPATWDCPEQKRHRPHSRRRSPCPRSPSHKGGRVSRAYRVINWSILPTGEPFAYTAHRSTTAEAARSAWEGLVTSEAERWLKHLDVDGHVGVAPVAPDTVAVQTFDRHGTLEAWRILAITPVRRGTRVGTGSGTRPAAPRSSS